MSCARRAHEERIWEDTGIPIATATIQTMSRPYGYKAHSVKRGALAHVVEAVERTDIPLYWCPRPPRNEPAVFAAHDNVLFVQHSQAGESHRHLKADSTALARMSWLVWDNAEDATLGAGHSVLSRRQHTRLPTPTESQTLPLHVKLVDRLDYRYVRQQALPQVRYGLNNLWAYLDDYKLCRSHESRSFAGHWGDQLLEAGVVEPAMDVLPWTLFSAFTVVEEKSAGDKLRCILWARALNEWLEEHEYVLYVPLSSEPWQVATANWGSARDPTCSFFQTHVSQRYRHLLRLPDSYGRVVDACVAHEALTEPRNDAHTGLRPRWRRAIRATVLGGTAGNQHRLIRQFAVDRGAERRGGVFDRIPATRPQRFCYVGYRRDEV
jgi:hypothetical protein